MATSKNGERFEPELPVVVADTWFALGRRVNPIVRAASERERMQHAKKWADDVNQTLREGFPDERMIQPEELIAFARTVNDLLQRKLDGADIAPEVRKLVNKHGTIEVRDHKPAHLAIIEDAVAFWALEYRGLFGDLARARTRDDWRKAVMFCENEKCGQFFIKQRIDQRCCSDKCRMAQRNREAAASYKSLRSHRKEKR